MIKNKLQIAGIRKSCKLAANCLKMIRFHVREGVTTEELDDIIRKYIYQEGGIPACLGYNGFPNSCCISVNEVVCHGVPNNYKLKKGDIFNIDVATVLDGYYGDCASMYWIDPVTSMAANIINIAQKCLDIGIKQIKPTNRVGAIGYAIQKYAMLQRVSVVECMTGHGVGLDFHETPLIPHIAVSKDEGPQLYPGMVITCEPMINLGGPDLKILEDGWTAITTDGSLSAQFEHTVLVTEKGYEILTM